MKKIENLNSKKFNNLSNIKGGAAYQPIENQTFSYCKWTYSDYNTKWIDAIITCKGLCLPPLGYDYFDQC